MKIALKISIILLFIVTASCKKDFQEGQKRMVLLTKPEGWLRLKIEQKLPTGVWLDVTGNPSPLEKDNVMIFDPWYNWAINEGKLKLPESQFIIAAGKWSFVDKGIQIEDGNLMEINELSESSLIVTISSTNSTTRYTYGHP